MEQSDRFEASQSDDGRYRLLIDAITDYAIYMLDPSGVVTSWNSGAQRFKGYQAPEILGRHFSVFYTNEERAAGAPARALRTALSEGRIEMEGWRVRKDGSHFWAHVIIDPIFSPSGEHIGFAKVTRDLTERQSAEHALKRREQEFQLLVQGVTDYAIYMLDPQGRVSNWNPGAERIKGYRPDEIVGSHFSRFYTEEDRAAGMPQQSLDTATREGRFEREGWRVRKDGERFWAHVVIDAIRNEAGELIGFAKITRDITERRETQRALDLAREALFHSQKMDAIGQLTGGVAHDFNNLLMAVLGSLELARKRLPDDPKVLALIDNAIQGAQRGASLTQRMLAFARRQELRPEVVKPAVLVHGMMGLLERSVGPGIVIETSLPTGLAMLTDANQLENALLNLAVNARDAMGERGRLRITARAERMVAGQADQLAHAGYVVLSITDSGEGMDEETLARATEPFFTTKGVGKGTGLGLSMVHGLAEQSGGRLAITSRKDEGTTIELWLPAAAADAAPELAAIPRAAEQPFAPLAVLAVDDDSLVLLNTVAMLEDLGHQVVGAASANEALALLRGGEAFDVVISDQAMPGMTGVGLAQAIAAEWPGLPVILATGYAELPPGVDPKVPKLAKPFLQRDLAEAVSEAHRHR